MSREAFSISPGLLVGGMKCCGINWPELTVAVWSVALRNVVDPDNRSQQPSWSSLKTPVTIATS